MGLLDYLEQARQRMLNTGTGLLNSRAAMDSVMPEVRAQGESEIMNHPGMQWAGLLGTMAGIGAKTADLVKLAAAQKMEKAGIDPAKIWSETGWGRSPGDGQWRFEIPDNQAKLTKNWETSSFSTSPNKVAANTELPIESAIQHDLLFNAYPDAANVKYSGRFEYGPDTSMQRGHITGNVVRGSAGGEYRPTQNFISSNGFGLDRAEAKTGVLSNTAHELQHKIQELEGFARGGSPSDFYINANKFTGADMQKFNILDAAKDIASKMKSDPKEAEALLSLYDSPQRSGIMDVINTWKPEQISAELSRLEKLKQEAALARNPHEAYRRLAGEAEARMTQARMHLTPEERLQNYPFQQGLLGYDVPVDQLITRFK